MDYDAAHLWITGLVTLWISQPCGLGRIYPHLSVLWISRFAGRAELARYTLRVPNEPGATLVSLAHPRL